MLFGNSCVTAASRQGHVENKIEHHDEKRGLCTMTPQRKQAEERLSEALRNLDQSVEQSASPELYSTLIGAFRSHHVRRRRAQRMRIVIAAAACLIVSLVLVRALRSPSGNSQANRGPARIQLIPPQDAEAADQQEAVQASVRATG